MELHVTYNKVQKRHTQALKTIMQKLKSGKSKEKHSTPQDLKYAYSYAMSCGNSMNGNDFIQKVLTPMQNGQQPSIPPLPQTETEMINDWINRTCGMSLKASKGRWYTTVRIDDYMPPELIQHYEQQAKKEIAERNRINNMSAQEKTRYTNSLLSKLRKSPGFAEVHFKA